MTWPTVPASELILKRGGSVNPSKFPDETFELLSIPAFDKNEPEILSGSEIGSSKSCIEPGDVLLSKIVPHIRRCWVVPEKREYRQIGSGEWIIFRDDRFDKGFLKHFLTSDIFHRQFMNTVAGVGGSLVRARPAEVERIEIPLPPLAEQKRIATILDKADAIRRKRQQAIQLADDFLRAVFLDMFGDPVTNPKGWETEKLGNISRIRRGASPRPISDFLGGDVPWIKIGDGSKGDQVYLHSTKEFVTQKGADKSRYLEAGALVFANCGVSLGFARILKISGCIHDGWLAIDELDSRINKVFLLKWINQLTLYFRSIAPDGTQPNLNTEIMKNQDVILPPIEEQKRYEVVLHKNERLLNQLRFSLTEIENNFESLSQKAFRGEL